MTETYAAHLAIANAEQIGPLDGSPEEVRVQGQAYTRMAEDVVRAAQDLRATIADADAHESEAMDALGERVDDVLPQLEKIRHRYDVAGAALTAYAFALESAQRVAAQAALSRDSVIDDARREVYRLEQQAAEPQDEGEVPATASPLDEYVGALQVAHRDWVSAVEDAQVAAERARDEISEAVDADGLTDSTWDSLSSWVSDNIATLSIIKDVVGGLAAIVGVAAIFFPVLEPLAVGLALGALAFSTLFASTGNGSWFDVGLDAVGVLTLGVGMAAGSAVRTARFALTSARTTRVAAAGNPGSGKLAQFGARYRARPAVTDDLTAAVAKKSDVMRNGTIWQRRIEQLRYGRRDGSIFKAIDENATVGARGGQPHYRVDQLHIRRGLEAERRAANANWTGLGGAVFSWSDELANGRNLQDDGIGGFHYEANGMREWGGRFSGLAGAYGDLINSAHAATTTG